MRCSHKKGKVKENRTFSFRKCSWEGRCDVKPRKLVGGGVDWCWLRKWKTCLCVVFYWFPFNVFVMEHKQDCCLNWTSCLLRVCTEKDMCIWRSVVLKVSLGNNGKRPIKKTQSLVRRGKEKKSAGKTANWWLD